MNLCPLVLVVFLAAGERSDYSQLMQQARAEYVGGHFVASEKLIVAAIQALQPGEDSLRAAALAELGDVYVSEDELFKAENAYSESLAVYRRLSDKTNTASLLQELGTLYSLQNRYDDALQLLQQALRLTKTLPGSNASLMASALDGLGMTYYRQGKTDKAGRFFNQALRLISASGVKFKTSALLVNLGVVYIAKRKFQEAEDVLKQALKDVEAEVGPQHPDLIFVLTALGVLYTDSGRYAEAEGEYLRALHILELRKPDTDTRIARILHRLSITYAKAGRKGEADVTLEKAAAIARQNLIQHPDIVTIVEHYSSNLRSEGRKKEADELRTEAKRARISAGLVIKAHNPF